MADLNKLRLRAVAGITGLCSLLALGMSAAPAAAKPPPHAPAHGYRRKTGDYPDNSRYRGTYDYDNRHDRRDRYDDYRDRRDRYDDYRYRDRDRYRDRNRRIDPYSPSGDLDRDGIPNRRDRDIDGDGVRNERDRYDYRRHQR